MLFGFNPLASLLLSLLDCDSELVPRFRDVYWNGENIVILTRSGGPNRVQYSYHNDIMKNVTGYIRDEDWTFDPTFANFYYSLPEKYEHLREWLNNKTSNPEKDFSDLYDNLISTEKLNKIVDSKFDVSSLTDEIKKKLDKDNK
jgi:hypothetical protein